MENHDDMAAIFFLLSTVIKYPTQWRNIRGLALRHRMVLGRGCHCIIRRKGRRVKKERTKDAGKERTIEIGNDERRRKRRENAENDERKLQEQ